MITPQKMNWHDPIIRHLKISLQLDIIYASDLFLRISIQIIVTSPILIQHNPYKNQASFAQVIDPIYSHASYFGKSTGSNKRTVSSDWHQRSTCSISTKILNNNFFSLGTFHIRILHDFIRQI